MSYLIYYHKKVKQPNEFIYEMEAQSPEQAIQLFWENVSAPEDFDLIKVVEKEGHKEVI